MAFAIGVAQVPNSRVYCAEMFARTEILCVSSWRVAPHMNKIALTYE